MRAFLLAASIISVAGSISGCFGRADITGGQASTEPAGDTGTATPDAGDPTDAVGDGAAHGDGGDGGDGGDAPPAPMADAAEGPAGDAADAPPGNVLDPDGPMAETHADGVDGPIDPDAPAADLASDHSPDGPPLSQVAAYRQLLDEQWATWSDRWSKCFNTPVGALVRDNSPLADELLAPHEFGLAGGLLDLDDTRARACLEALRTLPCEGIAARAFQATCAQALVGRVARGGFCVSPQDCRDPVTDDCLPQSPSGCVSRCAERAAPAAIGESCEQKNCAPDAACYIAPGQSPPPRCQLLITEGASCPDQLCVPGNWCLPATVEMPAGTCRKVAAGGTCQGSWQCPFPYACLIASGSTTGMCGPGRSLGETCSLQGIETEPGPFSDCASALFCYPDGGGAFKCGLGRDLGQSCQDLDVGGRNPLAVPCRLGFCRPVDGMPICKLDGQAGEDCDDDRPCSPGLQCGQNAKCRDPQVGLGQPCNTEGSAVCPVGARCALTAGSTTDGTCIALKRAGEPCGHPDDCEPGVECAGGTCLACR